MHILENNLICSQHVRRITGTGVSVHCSWFLVVLQYGFADEVTPTQERVLCDYTLSCTVSLQVTS